MVLHELEDRPRAERVEFQHRGSPHRRGGPAWVNGAERISEKRLSVELWGYLRVTVKCGKTTKSQLFGLPGPQAVGGPRDGRIRAGREMRKND